MVLKMDGRILKYKIKSISESKYGYLYWKKDERKKAYKFFPTGKFRVKMEGKIVKERKMNKGRARLNLYPLREKFNKGDNLILEKKEKDLIIIQKD